MTAPPDDTTTDLHAVIAALRAERDAALSEKVALTEALATRNSEYGERIEQQAATVDVLKIMAASPGDPQPVFDLIARRARDLCNTPRATLYEFDGELVHLRSRAGTDDAPDALEAYKRLFPMVPTRGSITCRAILDRQIIHVRDLAGEPGVLAAVRNLGHKSQISVPLLRDGAAIGAVAMPSADRRLFRQPGRIAANLRRAGGDRDHQRRDVSRVANPHERSSGNAGIPNGDKRCTEGHQPIGVRFAAGTRHAGRNRCQTL
jgi:hypothetical protein